MGRRHQITPSVPQGGDLLAAEGDIALASQPATQSLIEEARRILPQYPDQGRVETTFFKASEHGAKQLPADAEALGVGQDVKHVDFAGEG